MHDEYLAAICIVQHERFIAQESARRMIALENIEGKVISSLFDDVSLISDQIDLPDRPRLL